MKNIFIFVTKVLNVNSIFNFIYHDIFNVIDDKQFSFIEYHRWIKSYKYKTILNKFKDGYLYFSLGKKKTENLKKGGKTEQCCVNKYLMKYDLYRSLQYYL